MGGWIGNAVWHLAWGMGQRAMRLLSLLSLPLPPSPSLLSPSKPTANDVPIDSFKHLPTQHPSRCSAPCSPRSADRPIPPHPPPTPPAPLQPPAPSSQPTTPSPASALPTTHPHPPTTATPPPPNARAPIPSGAGNPTRAQRASGGTPPPEPATSRTSPPPLATPPMPLPAARPDRERTRAVGARRATAAAPHRPRRPITRRAARTISRWPSTGSCE